MANKMNFVKENRLGRFKIGNELIRNNPEDILKVMEKFIVVKCESLFFDNSLEYVAYSPLFRKVEHGEKIPAYLIEVKKNGGKELTVKAKEIKEL